MTDSEKLDLLLIKMNSVEKDVSFLKEDVSTLKEDVSTLKEDVSTLRKDVDANTREIIFLRKDVDNLKCQFVKSTTELKVMDKMILDEVERVHSILDMHKEDRSVHTA